MVKIDWLKLIGAIVFCQMAGAIGSFFTLPNIPTWYDTLNKPSFTPPGNVIGTVWIILYTLMGIALYLIWSRKKKSQQEKGAIIVFGVQLVLNSLWSFLFFGLRSPLIGLIGILAVWLAVAYTMTKFWKVSKTATYLLAPYMLWVSFASYLNFLIWQMN